MVGIGVWNMSTTNKTEGKFTAFLDNIWLQFGITTGITVLWLLWIGYEILIKAPPA
jgi:hypothetical protein